MDYGYGSQSGDGRSIPKANRYLFPFVFGFK